MKSRFTRSLVVTITFGAACQALHGAARPYSTADSNTVYLYHLDEAAGSVIAASTGSTTFNAYAFDGNPAANNATNPQPTNTTILGAAAFTGFGKSANISAADLGLGIDANASGGFQMGLNGGASPDAVAHSTLAGTDGSFTIDAMVNLPAITGAQREIVCTDNSAGTRGFQFRINTTGNLEFNFIGTAGAAYLVPIPTTGTHGFVANEWFHVALTYNGATNTSTYYWTRVSSGATAANPIGTPGTTETTLGTVTGPIVIGNEARSAGSGLNSGEGLLGFIDEVRISNKARAASEFIFYDDGSVDSDADGLSDLWETTNFGNLNQTGSDDPDGDGATNEQEETAVTNPNLATSWPDVDADGLKDAWETLNFGTIAAQGATGDPDGDLSSNLLEFNSATDPKNPISWPDTDFDLMNDGWETTYFGNLTKDGNADTDGDSYSDLAEHDAHTNPAASTGTYNSPIWAQLKNRWSFNGSLTDSVGGSNASIVDVGANNVTYNDITTPTGITLTGGTKATSDYVSLGSNLVPNVATPVTIELWAKQNTVQNWARIFDFQTDTNEYLMMSWNQAGNNATDRFEFKDAATSATVLTIDNRNQPYGTTDEHHILLTLEPLAGSAGRTKVTFYSAPSGSATLGAAKGTGETTINLVNFNETLNALGYSPYPDNTASATYNEVRIWNGAPPAWMREQLHDQGPDNASIPDTDADFLPDAWEEQYFPGNLSAMSTTGDNDADGTNNRDEYAAGSDPNNNLSTPDDSDADGLLDTWEIAYFGNITSQIGSGDPDNDGLTNEQEETAGSNPNNPDDDADGLTDAWERTYFGTLPDPLIHTGTDDPDGDGFTNEQEETAASNPALAASTPTDTDADSLIDTFEVAYFTTLNTQTGSDDPDADGSSNSIEQAAGSNPTLAASTPADTDGDGIVDTAELIKPYTADANTLHLWHLDEITAPAADAGSAPVSLTSLQNGALLWSPSTGGFGTGLNTAAAANARLGALPEAADLSDNAITSYAGADGAFTMEAIVRIGFNPVATAAATTMQILSADGDTDANRQFQFRIRYNTANVPTLEFINLLGAVGVQIVGAPIPLTGDHAIAQNGWFHVAVTYDGTENSAGNIKLYWTKLDPAYTQANAITTGAENLAADMIVPVEGSDLVIGNEGRANGGTTDRFVGTIDEVRVSSIARSATGFLFPSGGNDLDADGMDDAWETANFGGTTETATGDFDGDGTDNLTEFRLGLTPTSGNSRFVVTRGSGGLLEWPSTTGVNFSVQRSTTLGAWTTIATVPGTAGTASFTDPSPPAGSAFYRIALEP